MEHITRPPYDDSLAMQLKTVLSCSGCVLMLQRSADEVLHARLHREEKVFGYEEVFAAVTGFLTEKGYVDPEETRVTSSDDFMVWAKKDGKIASVLVMNAGIALDVSMTVH